LELQNSVLKSELQIADRSSRDAEEELNNFKKFYSQNQLSMNGNFFYIPALNEYRKIMDLNLDALPMPDVQSRLSFEPECTGKKEEFMDFKLGYSRQVNDVEMERIAALNESQTCHEDFPNMKEKLDRVDKLNLERNLRQELLQSRNISRKSKNKDVPEGYENKDDNEPFESSCVIAQQEHHIDLNSSEADYLFSKPDQLIPTKGIFIVEASREHGGYAYERKPVQERAIASVPSVIEKSTGKK